MPRYTVFDYATRSLMPGVFFAYDMISYAARRLLLRHAQRFMLILRHCCFIDVSLSICHFITFSATTAMIHCHALMSYNAERC